MARRRKPTFNYNEVDINGYKYLKTYVQDHDGNQTILYGKTIEELIEKVDEAKARAENNQFIRKSPTVKEYCEKWLLMQSANVRYTTMVDYTSKVRRHIIKPLGHLRMAEVTTDDIKMALVPVSEKSASVFKSVNILLKCIFDSAVESRVINITRQSSCRQKAAAFLREKKKR